ncbi:MAG: hypothetical protein RL226_167, partial [Bacteroidota bacterium]
VLNNYAYYLALRGDKLNRAEELSKKSLEMKPESASFQDTYGWILFRLGRYDEARQFIERAISTGGSDAVVLEHLGDVYFHLGDIDNALRLWNDALKSGSNERLSRKIADRKYYEE